MKRSDLLELLHEDDDIVIVNKPAQLAAIPGRAETDSVIERLSRQLSLPMSGQADPRLRVVHRIDKDTTGVMLFAKHFDAQRHLSHQFQNNTVTKEYLALVGGRVEQDQGSIEAPIAPHPTMRDRMAISKHGRPAKSDWKVEQRLRHFSVVRVFPKTGKTHQIRVHFLHIGHTLAIDPLYGSADPIFLSAYKRHYRPTKGQEERPLIARLTLHAHRLRFVHPNGTDMQVEAPIPKDLRATIAQLGKV